MSQHCLSIPSCDLVIFGAKGDLTRRKLLPALYQLDKNGYLPKETKILAVGRAEWSQQDYANIAKESLTTFMNESLDDEILQRFCQRLDFHNLDLNHIDAYPELKTKITNNQYTIFYFATSPSTFSTICYGLGQAGFNHPNTRIVIEKSVGNDLPSSQEINNTAAKYFNESQIFRIDHFLAKETMLNLFALRFANPIFYNLWDHKAIDHVQITVAEQVGIEGRWGYFDKAGEMRDMMQNHLLQILTIIAMEPPISLLGDNLRQEKINVLNALRPINRSNVDNCTVRGQYTAGTINHSPVPGYLNEEGANQDSQTETFVAIRIDIDNWRWAGVPFYLRTGKRMARDTSEVVIYFKDPALNLFTASNPQLSPNKLIIHIDIQEGVEIEILSKVPGLESDIHLQPTKLKLNFNDVFHQHIADSYERLFVEVMLGRQALFVRRDEVEAAWQWIDTIIDAWSNNKKLPEPYKAGTWGPEASSELITKDNRSWHDF